MDLESVYSGHMLTEQEIEERIRRAKNQQDDSTLYSATWNYYEGMIVAYKKVLNKV